MLLILTEENQKVCVSFGLKEHNVHAEIRGSCSIASQNSRLVRLLRFAFCRKNMLNTVCQCKSNLVSCTPYMLSGLFEHSKNSLEINRTIYVPQVTARPVTAHNSDTFFHSFIFGFYRLLPLPVNPCSVASVFSSLGII